MSNNPMKPMSMAKILQECELVAGRKNKIDFLRQHYSHHFHEALAFGYDERVVWNLPPGIPPYRPLQSDEAEFALHRECRLGKLYYFVEGGKGANLSPLRREELFVNLLESIDEDDAKLLIALKNKSIPYRGITGKLIEEAFGELK